MQWWKYSLSVLRGKKMCRFSIKHLPATLCQPRCWVKTKSSGIKLTIWQKSQGRWCSVWETAAWQRSPSPTPRYLALLTSLTACPQGEHNTWSTFDGKCFFVHFDPLLGTPRGAKAEKGLDPIFKMESKWDINYNYKSLLCEAKQILFLGQTIYLYIVFQYPSPYDYSIYTDYLRVSFFELVFILVALFCNICL